MPARSSSGEGSLTPRRSRSRRRTRRLRNAAGACTSACARAPGVSTGTRIAAAREMPTTQARPRRLAWQGARQVPPKAHPSAHRRSVPAHPRAAGDAPRRLPVILLQELDNQPPPRVEVQLGRDEASKLSKAHRLVTHNHTVANTAHAAPLPGRGPLSGHAIGAEAAMPAPQATSSISSQLDRHSPKQPHARMSAITTHVVLPGSFPRVRSWCSLWCRDQSGVIGTCQVRELCVHYGHHLF